MNADEFVYLDEIKKRIEIQVSTLKKGRLKDEIPPKAVNLATEPSLRGTKQSLHMQIGYASSPPATSEIASYLAMTHCY